MSHIKELKLRRLSVSKNREKDKYNEDKVLKVLPVIKKKVFSSHKRGSIAFQTLEDPNNQLTRFSLKTHFFTCGK